ncbi:hypothetical protein L3Q82_022507, partial [Scortum barcoo]
LTSERNLTWTHHTDFITNSARQQALLPPQAAEAQHGLKDTLCSFYRCTIESILTDCIIAWYSSSCTALQPTEQAKIRSKQRLQTTGGWRTAVTQRLWLLARVGRRPCLGLCAQTRWRSRTARRTLSSLQARLIRRGWTEDGKKMGRQFTHFDSSPRQPSVSRSDGNQGPKRVEICPKDPRIGRIVVVNSRKVDVDKETSSEKKAEEAEQMKW